MSSSSRGAGGGVGGGVAGGAAVVTRIVVTIRVLFIRVSEVLRSREEEFRTRELLENQVPTWGRGARRKGEGQEVIRCNPPEPRGCTWTVSPLLRLPHLQFAPCAK